MSEEKRNIDKMLMEMFPGDPGIAECFIGILNVISGPVPPKQPELIQGYTAEQWDEIIAGGYLCNFSDINGSEISDWVAPLDSYRKGIDGSADRFERESAHTYKFCRPAQLKGVMRPIFVEPVDEGNKCMFFNKHSDPLGSLTWRDKPIFSKVECATKYIEL